MSDIGLLNEKPLHAALKQWYAQPGDRFEVKVDNYFIDMVRDDVLIEIQTKNFSSIRKKLTNLLRTHRLRLIYPVPLDKWIVKLSGPEQAQPSRRKSPKRGRFSDIFNELVRIPELLSHANLSILVLLIREDELRTYCEKKNWHRKGWGIVERRLLEVVGEKFFSGPDDWCALLPQQLTNPFTTKDMAEVMDIRMPLAQKIAYCFREAQFIGLVAKKGRWNLYERTEC